jgi:hypothetical protein
MDVLSNLAPAIVGLVASILGIWGAYYTKRHAHDRSANKRE